MRIFGSLKKSQNLMEKSHPLERNAKKENPLVSIIIPTYNYGHYLSDAIESALRQTYPNIEVIVVDDGSTDNTKNIAKCYPIRYFFQKNQGVAIAMNNGIKSSHGEFYVTLGADDKLAPEFVSKTMEQMMKDPNIGFVRTGSKLWDEEMGIENILMPRKIYTKYAIFAIGWIGPLGTVLTRRAAFNSLNGGFDPTLPAQEDVDLCFRLCLKGWKTEVVFEPLHWYRIHKASRNLKAAQMRKYAESALDRKFWYRKPVKRVYAFYVLPLRRAILLMSHPIDYLRGIEKKIKVKIWIGSYDWNNLVNREGAYEISKEVWLTVDILLEWFKNRKLRDYYVRRLETLESRLQEIFSDDAVCNGN